MIPEPGQFKINPEKTQAEKDTIWAKGYMQRTESAVPGFNEARRGMGVFSKGTSKAGENVRVVAREGDRNVFHYPQNPTYTENMGRLTRLHASGEAARLAAEAVPKTEKKFDEKTRKFSDVPVPKKKTVKIKSGGAGGVDES